MWSRLVSTREEADNRGQSDNAYSRDLVVYPPPRFPPPHSLCALIQPYPIVASLGTQTTGAEACGTCTLKELHGIMARVGSDLFPCGQEDLEGLAAQCGVMDGCVR